MNHKEATLNRNIKMLKSDRDYTVENGIMTWNSNGNVPFDDMLEAAICIGEDIDMAACRKAREEKQDAFLLKYFEAQANRSDEQIAEERFEARAAMGPGVEMVNVITGERYTT
jgi:hypothetical protein